MYIVWCIVGSVLWGLAGRADISILRQRPADDELLTADTAATAAAAATANTALHSHQHCWNNCTVPSCTSMHTAQHV